MDISNNIDFVIPLHRYHYLIRATLEAITTFYNPRNIYIITPKENIDILNKMSNNWNIKKIIIYDDETFFIQNYKLLKIDIEKYYKYIDEKSREFGWWYQQLIKLGSFKQIKNLSDPYVVWDSDLIPLIKWNIYNKSNNYKFAILQEKSQTIWHTEQYRDSIYELAKINVKVLDEGTFVPHHFIMYHNVLYNLLNHIEYENKDKDNWILCIIKLSNKYYRFSEYMLLASYTIDYFPNMLNYYEFKLYGKYGIRIRNSKDFLEKIVLKCDIKEGISYITFCNYIKIIYRNLPTYIQIEHI